MKIILASNNQKKLRELKAILSDLDVEIMSQAEAGCDFEVDETGTTFEENAYLKAKAVFDAKHITTVADDSGLMVEALNGEPGIYSARYAPGGHDATDTEKCEYLLQRIGDAENRKAKFCTCICCIFENGEVFRVHGELHGEILSELKGEGGFGYDPVFMPEGYDTSMAVLGEGVKNRISHRAKALAEFKKKLREVYGTDK